MQCVMASVLPWASESSLKLLGKALQVKPLYFKITLCMPPKLLLRWSCHISLPFSPSLIINLLEKRLVTREVIAGEEICCLGWAALCSKVPPSFLFLFCLPKPEHVKNSVHIGSGPMWVRSSNYPTYQTKSLCILEGFLIMFYFPPLTAPLTHLVLNNTIIHCLVILLIFFFFLHI